MSDINPFIHQVFIDSLSNKEKFIICKHIKELLIVIDEETANVFQQEIDLLKTTIANKIDQLTISIENEALSINTIYTKLKKERKILLHHPLSFLCVELQFNKYNQTLFNKYKAYVLLCAIRLTTDKIDSFIDNVFNEIRQFAVGRRDFLLPLLPQAQQLTLLSLIKKLDIERHNKTYLTSVKHSLSKYFHLFHRAYYRDRVNTRKRKNIEARKRTAIILEPSHTIDEDDNGYQLYELKTYHKAHSKYYKKWQTEEANSFQADKQTIALINSKNPAVYEKQQRAMQAQAMANRIKVRKQSLPCDFKILTEYEIKVLITACLQKMEREEHKAKSIMLLLSLLCGRTTEEIIKRQRKKKSKFIYCQQDNCWKLRLVHKTDTFYQEYAVSHLLSEVKDRIEIKLPSYLSWIMGRYFKFPPTCEVKDFLAKLNKKHKTRLSQSRIANYLVDFNRAQNADMVLIEVILGLEGLHNSGMPYSHITSNMILTIFEKYCLHLQKVCSKKITTQKDNKLPKLFKLDINDTSPATNLGSPLLISDAEIVRANNLHRKHIQELQQIKNQYITFHNQYIFYIYKMLTIASGYRPVTGTGGKLFDICLNTGRYWISDKENRQGISARCIVLPELVIAQIKAYLSYLELLLMRFTIKSNDNYYHISNVINGTEHLLFFLDEETLKITEVTPNTIHPFMDVQFPIALNWHRHYMRSKLMAKNIDPALINAFMGHEEIGQEALGRFSGLSHYDFNKLAKVIGKILETLEFKVIAHD